MLKYKIFMRILLVRDEFYADGQTHRQREVQGDRQTDGRE
jgi:hypothetical protein